MICCATAVDAIGTVDTNAVFNTVTTLVPNVEAALKAISAKSKDFKKNEFATAYVQYILPELDEKVSKLNKCLIDRAPMDKAADGKAYVDRVTAAFEAAKAVYPQTDPATASAPTAADTDTKPATEVMPVTAPNSAPAAASSDMKLATEGMSVTTTGSAPAAAGADTKAAPEGMTGAAVGNNSPQ